MNVEQLQLIHKSLWFKGAYMLLVEKGITKSENLVESIGCRWEGGMRLGLFLEKKAEPENRGYAILNDIADWVALTNVSCSRMAAWEVWKMSLASEICENFMANGYISEQRDHPSGEDAPWNQIINAGYRADKRDPEKIVGRYSPVRSFLMDLVESEKETLWV